MDSCVFCKSDIKEASFMETDNFLAIYNISPILPGHSLIIPKRHISSFLELSQNELTEFISLGQKTAKILSDYFKKSAFNLSIQDGIAAGQTVYHLHMHIIPRVENDLKEPGDWFSELQKKFYHSETDSSERTKLSKEELLEIVKDLKYFIG